MREGENEQGRALIQNKVQAPAMVGGLPKPHLLLGSALDIPGSPGMSKNNLWDLPTRNSQGVLWGHQTRPQRTSARWVGPMSEGREAPRRDSKEGETPSFVCEVE